MKIWFKELQSQHGHFIKLLFLIDFIKNFSIFEELAHYFFLLCGCWKWKQTHQSGLLTAVESQFVCPGSLWPLLNQSFVCSDVLLFV